MPELPIPSQGNLLTHVIASDDVERSRRFHTEALDGEPAIVALANSWIDIKPGGGAERTPSTP